MAAGLPGAGSTILRAVVFFWFKTVPSQQKSVPSWPLPPLLPLFIPECVWAGEADPGRAGRPDLHVLPGRPLRRPLGAEAMSAGLGASAAPVPACGPACSWPLTHAGPGGARLPPACGFSQTQQLGPPRSPAKCPATPPQRNSGPFGSQFSATLLSHIDSNSNDEREEAPRRPLCRHFTWHVGFLSQFSPASKIRSSAARSQPAQCLGFDCVEALTLKVIVFGERRL